MKNDVNTKLLDILIRHSVYPQLRLSETTIEVEVWKSNCIPLDKNGSDYFSLQKRNYGSLCLSDQASKQDNITICMGQLERMRKVKAAEEKMKLYCLNFKPSNC